MRFSICLETFYPQLGVVERLQKLHAAGFDGVEFWSPYDKDLEALGRQLRRLEMRLCCFSAHRRASPVRADEREAFLAEVEQNVAAARRLACPGLMVLSDALEPEGAARPAPFSRERKLLALARALEGAAPLAAAAGVTLLLEPLNLQDHPGVFLHRVETAAALLDHVSAPHVKLLVDVYHLQRQEGHVLETLKAHLALLGHVHLAEVPGRGAPGQGELHFAHILEALRGWGYRGTVGFECFPAPGEEDRALEAIRRLIDPFLGGQP